MGIAVFTCITGESYPTDDYEIDATIKKRENNKGRIHIDELDPSKISGFLTDDGYQINEEIIKKHLLRLRCVNNDNPKKETLCQMIDMNKKTIQNLYALLKKT